jgi:hypothetical protein
MSRCIKNTFPMKHSTKSSMDGKDKQQDIRQWLSPPRGSSSNSTPARRRRVMSTSESEAERIQHHPGGNAAAAGNDADTQVPIAANPPQPIRGDDVVVLETSAESSDDMWIRPPVRERSEAGHNQQVQQDHIAGRRTARNPARNTTRRPRPDAQPQRPQRRMRQAEAVESSVETDDDSSCVESDTNARSQYRDAILGVRNANRGRQQMRANTQRCPVCAQFSAFLIHFM